MANPRDAVTTWSYEPWVDTRPRMLQVNFYAGKFELQNYDSPGRLFLKMPILNTICCKATKREYRIEP